MGCSVRELDERMYHFLLLSLLFSLRERFDRDQSLRQSSLAFRGRRTRTLVCVMGGTFSEPLRQDFDTGGLVCIVLRSYDKVRLLHAPKEVEVVITKIVR